MDICISIFKQHVINKQNTFNKINTYNLKKTKATSQPALLRGLGGARRYKIRTAARNPTDSKLILIDDRLTTSPPTPYPPSSDIMHISTKYLLIKYELISVSFYIRLLVHVLNLAVHVWFVRYLSIGPDYCYQCESLFSHIS